MWFENVADFTCGQITNEFVKRVKQKESNLSLTCNLTCDYSHVMFDIMVYCRFYGVLRN